MIADLKPGDRIWVSDGCALKARDFWSARVTYASPAGVVVEGGAAVPWSSVHRTRIEAIRAALNQLKQDQKILEQELDEEANHGR